MTDLLSQLEAATEGSRELDDRIWRFINEIRQAQGDGWKYDLEFAPHYTTNLQDAVSLFKGLWIIGRQEECFCRYLPANQRGDFIGSKEYREVGATPELAACIAIIKAHESKAEAA